LLIFSFFTTLQLHAAQSCNDHLTINGISMDCEKAKEPGEISFEQLFLAPTTFGAEYLLPFIFRQKLTHPAVCSLCDS